MGRSSSKFLETPNSPLQEMQYRETKRALQKRNQEKEQKRIAKLQKKQAKKNKKKDKKKTKKNKNRASLTKRTSGVERLKNPDYQIENNEINKSEFNRQMEEKIHMQLENDLCTFLMNHISLGTQFFGNFNSEMTNTMEEMLSKENAYNQHLDEHSILLTNPIDAIVAKWVKYKPTHGPDKHRGQVLQPQTLYVIFENIDIARPNDANYDSISALCKVEMDTDYFRTTPCKEDYVDMLREIKWKGYVRLKMREDPKLQKNLSSNVEEYYTECSSGYSTTSVYSTKKFTNERRKSFYSSDCDYDYTYITRLNTNLPLNELQLSSSRSAFQVNEKVLPESCVSSLENFIELINDLESDEESEEEEYDDDEEDGYSTTSETGMEKYKDYETLEAIRLYKIEQEHRKKLLRQKFLNSREFLCYFSALIQHKLREPLGLSQEELTTATYRGCSIHTEQFEIIPAIHVAHNAQNWPDCAFQFRIRDRPVFTNPSTGQQMQWPTRAMIKRIETFGFHVVPMGYVPKRQRNPFREIEWRIVFPKAERYLEQHLTNTQVKVFIMAKALIKTFVEQREKNKALLFVVDHLRMHLFWECERNYIAWPEEFLGEVLIRFLKTYMQSLREKCLRDYFIDERNLLENIPDYSLITLYSILADITANPLMHLMVALRNLEFSEKFFPKLNFKRIFENLSENYIIKLKTLSKNSRTLSILEKEEEEPSLMVDEGAKGLVGMKQFREKTNGKLRRRTHLMRHNIEVKKKLDYEQKRISIESIDVEFFFTKDLKNTQARHINQGLESLRRTNILEVLLDHLLAMSNKAIHMQIAHTAKIYIAQAKRLCKCYHKSGCDINAKEYLSDIHKLEEKLLDIEEADEHETHAPALPIRASIDTIQSFQKTKEQLLDRVETAKSNFYVEVKSDSEKNRSGLIEHSPKVLRPRVSIITCGDDSMTKHLQINDKLKSPSPIEPRKSIKFIEHIVEVHEGDINPIQKPDVQHPIGILRSQHNYNNSKVLEDKVVDVSSTISEEEVTCGISQIPTLETAATPLTDATITENTSTPTSTTADGVSSKPFWTKFGTAAGILKSTPIANSKLAKNISTSTEKILTTISAEEKTAQIRDMVKRKTVQLKGAFNQISDT
ncbi:uncharacterized protein LOC119671242 [Teleopsis dalmanni]|uniref:uncharacterized protein LOC119671242 n=1 Tax=Teleopsis dalmanni TaxID=139649 RepID=UPI0018CDB5F8|nr:uncharacterized protein LOC119671242 [Teleopsis dalmanni]